MAEVEQPKKGSTSKFQDALGKTDALIYNALGVNVESLLNALGIKSLKELMNIDFNKVNWGALLSILYTLNPAQIKALLSRFSFSNLSLGTLLKFLGVPQDVIQVLEQIKSAFLQGGGIFTGGTQILGIADSFTPASGWLPGKDESLLDIYNPPKTGITLRTSNNPNNSTYVTPGSENMLNVLAGVNSLDETISALVPEGGIGYFYYKYIETPVRYESSKFWPFNDVGGFDIIRSYFSQQLGYIPEFGDMEIVTNEGRIDLCALDALGETQYFWILLMYNGIIDVNELTTGKILKIPDKNKIEELYFRVKSIGGDI